ncbi:MAG: DNA polymerase IV [Syntrophomonadaceae bacterium]|nr:DNA polymerase IV [Syntrophomonadaceae bacterium]
MTDAGTSLTVIHCDLDAFFAAVEQRDNPSLKGKPVIIGGQPQSRGVVATASYEARQYGIKSAMPLTQAYRLCPHAVFLPVDMGRYKEASRQVLAILSSYTPVIEPLSIDEAFLDVSGCTSIFGFAEKIAESIKRRVKTEVGLNISVGISYNKFLAKLATELGKPDGLEIIRPEEALDILRPLPVSYLWGVGAKSQQKLKSLGINTIGELRQIKPEKLEKHLGSPAFLLWELANGIDKRKVEPYRERKSIGKETTFQHDVDDFSKLEKTMLYFAGLIGRRLREENMSARKITVKVRYSNFKTVTRSKTLREPFDSDSAIYNAAGELLKQVYNAGEKVRLIGLYVGSLQLNGSWEQGTLFTDDQTQPNVHLDKVLDKIRQRFGQDVITRASLLERKRKKRRP